MPDYTSIAHPAREVTERRPRVLRAVRNEPVDLPNDPTDLEAWRRAVQHIAAAAHIDVRWCVPDDVAAVLGFGESA